MEKLISVIVPVYNIEAYLPRCVDSLLAQTFQNLEIILVDDGSADTSGSICDSYARKDGRVKAVHKKNGGLSDARNAGMDMATGEYIGFVDGDDWIDQDMYRAMYEACEKEQAQIAVCRYKQIRTSSGETLVPEIDAPAGNSVSLSKTRAMEAYLCEDETYVIYNSVWSKLFLAKLVEDIRFPVGKNSEDIMFTTKAFCRMERLAYLDAPYYNYVLDREGSIMNEKIGQRRLKDEIPFWREQISHLAKEGLTELSDKAAYHFYRRLLFYYIDFMESKDTRYFAGEITKELRKEKENIRRIYKEGYVATGDKVRMRLVLAFPFAYYCAVKGYDKYVIPLRTKS
ncbi:glycosyltransferase involved in cell wall biosynthesis [Kineothrix alysoides]|uniref:Glycosyltransferase involved in cell wall biosynthesis n=1 Tax=Kineothrix alysoides TaxID=1469948 RepID=A0A4R1R235_9FIRM|nr:glycosyltransferase [Kineothrix alysoides]TCL59411.1 glycosyltransferase involved in cell wall biosynthesis [Kineothrix alysoides]